MNKWKFANGVIFLTVFAVLFQECLSEAAGTDTGLSLSDAVSIALSRNPGLKILEAQTASLASRSAQAFAPAMPSLFYARSNAPGLLSGDPASFTWGINWSLNFPGKAFFEARQYSAQSDASDYNSKAKAVEIESHVRFLFQAMRIKEEILKILTAERVRTLELIRLVETKYGSAQALQADLLNAKANFGALEGEILEAEGERDALLYDFRATLSAPENNEIFPRVEESQSVPQLPENPSLLLAIAEKNQPSLVSAKYGIHAAEAAVTRAALSVLPDFQVSVSTTKNHLFEARNNAELEQDYSASLTATIPLFFWLDQRKNIQIASRDLDAAENSAQATKLALVSDLNTLFRSYTVLRKKMENYTHYVLPSFKSSYDLSLRAYSIGRVDYIRLQDKSGQSKEG